MSYKIKLDYFEGPLDLLYQLIESKKLEITQISLAQVTGQFLEYLKKIPGANVSSVADFLVVAGRLALIKSRALLPFLELAPEEEKDIAALEQQLAEYQKYKELSKEILKLDKFGQKLYSRGYLENLAAIFYFPKNLTAQNLAGAAANLLEGITLPHRIPQARAIDIVPLEQKIAELEEGLKARAEIIFSDILKTTQPEEKVVAFLSVLELIKRNRVETFQAKNFDKICLKKVPLIHAN
ncbi:MAG: segregation/condensation protein A [Patescibacteria group bacterium]